MSRTLSKILVICAMVVLFPLMIVGTAFAAYYSIDASVEIAVYTNYTSAAEDAFAKFAYGNKVETKATVTTSHLKDISLSTISNGYDFVGWFEGDLEAYSLAHSAGEVAFVSTDADITFKSTEFDKLLAVFEVQEYTTRFSYKAVPTDLYDTTTTPETNDDAEAVLSTYRYGDALPRLAYSGVDYQFKGWKIVGDTDETIYTRATFDTTEEITLTAVWQEGNKLSVKYYNENGDVLSESEIYEHEDYAVESVGTLISSTKPGYEYSWRDADGNISSSTIVDPTQDLEFYLSKEVIIYTANLTLPENTTFNGLTTISIDFTVENTSNFEVLLDKSKWGTEYSFYDVAQLIYNGEDYTLGTLMGTGTHELGTLATDIIKDYPEGTEQDITVEARIVKHYKNFAVTNIVYAYEEPLNNPVYTEEDLGEGGSQYQVEVGTIPSTSTIYQLLNLYDSVNGNVKLYTKDGREVSLVALQVRVVAGGALETYAVTGDMTVNDLIELILNNTNVSLSDMLTVDTIKAFFA